MDMAKSVLRDELRKQEGFLESEIQELRELNDESQELYASSKDELLEVFINSNIFLFDYSKLNLNTQAPERSKGLTFWGTRLWSWGQITPKTWPTFSAVLRLANSVGYRQIFNESCLKLINFDSSTSAGQYLWKA